MATPHDTLCPIALSDRIVRITDRPSLTRPNQLARTLGTIGPRQNPDRPCDKPQTQLTPSSTIDHTPKAEIQPHQRLPPPARRTSGAYAIAIEASQPCAKSRSPGDC